MSSPQLASLPQRNPHSRFVNLLTAEDEERVTCQAGDLASGGSCSLGQVGASAKEVSHKAEAKIPGNAASIHAEDRNGGV
jgi:hypothetical protein